MVDRELFERWIDRHHPGLFRHALWMTGDRALAADLVQEAYYRAWKGRTQLRDSDKAFSWLLTILRRAVFEEYGRAARTRELAAAFAGDEGMEADDLAGRVDLAQALQRLLPAQRDILLLYTLHGFGYQEISEQLDIPLGTVMSRLARARAALSEALAPATEGRIVTLAGRKRQT